MRNRLFSLSIALLFGAVSTVMAQPADPAAPAWDRVTVDPMKTSIYVGSVTLTMTVFERTGDSLASTYSADVFPWFFWGETGSISITLTEADRARLAKRETIEFTGDATNHKKKPRTITGRAQPADATSGKMKVRIMADGIELIFNGTYKLDGT